MSARSKRAATELSSLGEATKEASVPDYEKKPEVISLEDRTKVAGVIKGVRGLVDKFPDLKLNFGDMPQKAVNYAKENPGKTLGIAGAGLLGAGIYGGARLAGKAIKGYKNNAALYGGGALAGVGGLSYMAGKGSGEQKARKDYMRNGY